MDHSKNLVPIQEHQIGSTHQKCVSARELHNFLEVKSRFNDWIANRIKIYDFIENQDFMTFTEFLVNGGRSIEYAITLDMAKELSMIERTDKGKQARRYFIQCEKQLQQAKSAMQDYFDDPIIGVRLKQLQLEQRLTKIEAKVTNRNEDYYSIAGYARLKGIRVSISEARSLGKAASKHSKANGIQIDTIKEARYGSINIYHTSVLEIVFTHFLNPVQS